MMRVLQAALLLVGLLSLPASACSVHDHSCNFHGMGRVVNPNIDPAAPTAVYIVTEGTTSSDFDNNVLLPDNQGPYVISSTGYPTRSDQPYIGATEQPRHVYPTQYQIDFNNNTAQATHSGDLNGLENIPGATGCNPEISSATYCEAVRISGNIPDTFASDGIGFFVRQTNHLYNAQNVADPSNELQSYAVATGSAFIRTFGHGFVDESGTRTGYNYDSLSATGQQGQENTYYIGYSGFQPHAMGAPVYYNERWSTYGSAYETQLQHKIFTYQDRTDHSQQRFVSGAGEMWTDNYGRSDPIRTLLDVRDVPKFEINWQRGCRDSLCSNLRPDLQFPIFNVNTANSTAFVIYEPVNIIGYDDKIVGGIRTVQEELDRQGVKIALRALEAEGIWKVGPYTELAFHSLGTSAANLFILDPAAGITNCVDFNCSGSDAIETIGAIPAAKIISAGGKLIRVSDGAADAGVDIYLTLKPEWNSDQISQAYEKAEALTNSSTFVSASERGGPSASTMFKQAGNEIPLGYDIDHVVDIQLGGINDISNLKPLDTSVNRSFGIQIHHQIKDLPEGTVINNVIIK